MQVGTVRYPPLFGLLVIHFLMQGYADSSCPPVWMKYERHCYGVFFNKQDWAEAEMECQSYGHSGHLVSILADHEAEILSKYILNNHPEVESLWIGLRDRLQKGRWRWADSSTSKFTAWVGGEPTKIDESGFCAYLSVKQDFRKWVDGFCTTPMSYVCEFIL